MQKNRQFYLMRLNGDVIMTAAAIKIKKAYSEFSPF